MKFLKLALPMLALTWFGTVLSAEDAPAVDAPKTSETKPADNGELPKAPEGTAPLTASTTETLTGDISKAAASEKGKAKKKKKEGADSSNLVLAVSKPSGKDGKKADKEKGQKTPKTVTLSASGDVLTQLTAFAEKNAHVKVTGTMNGNVMTVKEVAEAPAEEAKKKKKKNDA